MRQIYALLIVFITSLLFSGCVQSYTDSFKFKYYHSTVITNFSNLTEKLLDKLSPKINTLETRHPIYVIDFVNLKELENHSELGFMLSDELKTHVTQKLNWAVQSIEYTKYLKIGASGTKLLSRDVEELKSKKINSNGYALIGTYAFTQRQLILYLKLIDLSNGVILKSSTQATMLTDEIIDFELKPKEQKESNIYQPMVL
jgi:TolB-like protein